MKETRVSKAALMYAKVDAWKESGMPSEILPNSKGFQKAHSSTGSRRSEKRPTNCPVSLNWFRKLSPVAPLPVLAKIARIASGDVLSLPSRMDCA
jgi:hypothetical protein